MTSPTDVADDLAVDRGDGSQTAGRGAATSANAVTKRAMRVRIRAERRARDATTRAADAASLARVVMELPEVARAGCVAVYAALPGEPETEPLRRRLRRVGVRVLLPVVLDDGTLDWSEDLGELRRTDRPGGPEPVGERLGRDAVALADVVLVPALAADTLGARLGQGAGYYDRTLRRVRPGVPVMAVVHESELLDAAVEPVPTEAHDLPVDAVVTPARCLRLRHRPRPAR